MDDTRLLGVRLGPALDTALREHAARLGRDKSAVVRQMLEAVLLPDANGTGQTPGRKARHG